MRVNKSPFFDFKNKTGIYRIINTINNKFYIGSANNFYVRWHLHISRLRKNKHNNSYLQSSFNKYGESSFLFEVIEECEPKILIEREQYWVQTLNPNYNIRTVAASNIGLKWSQEAKDRKKAKYPPRKIYEYDLNGNFIKEWRCALEASKELSYTYSSINFNLNGKFNKCKNSIFRYEKLEKIDAYTQKRPDVVRKTYVIQRDKSGKVLQIFKGSKECSKALGYNNHTKVASLIFHSRFDKLNYTLEYGDKYF